MINQAEWSPDLWLPNALCLARDALPFDSRSLFAEVKDEAGADNDEYNACLERQGLKETNELAMCSSERTSDECLTRRDLKYP